MASSSDRLSAALSDRYRIERELGQGGMATVYLAQDLKHDRKVAIKVLKPELAAVLGAERFVVEIRTTASLQHPHILPLFDSGTADGFLYYVMPYIQGETIREKLNRETQFGVEEAVRITREVADALDYAHRHGVIHRDIKPENLLVHDGRAMVMDFGIALAVSAAAGGRMTETGLSLGTPHYMSPEQATAEKEITARSDVYSLASVLYETLSGEPPHTGGSAQQVIMKIITDTPRPVNELRKNVPPTVVAALARALEKLPADRFATANEFSLALQGRGDPSGLAAYTHAAPGDRRVLQRSRTREIVSWALVGTLASAVAWTQFKPRATVEGQRVVQFMLATPDSLRPVVMSPYSAAISRDGRVIVYSSTRPGGVASLQAFRTDRLDSREIPGTRGAGQPIFSPDGQSIAFESGGKLRTMRLDGSSPVAISDGRTQCGVAWTVNDELILGADAGFHGLSKVSAQGGQLTEFTRPDTAKGETEHWYPLALDDGETVIFSIIGNSLGTAQLAMTSITEGTVTRLGVPGFRPLAVLDGMLVYLQLDGTVNAVALDVRGRRVSGTPVAVYGPVPAGGGNGEIFISSQGALVAANADRASQLLWIRRDGTRTPVAPESRAFTNARLSHNERRLAAVVTNGQESDIWIHDIVAGTTSPLTTVKSAQAPAWSNDDSRVFYFANGADGTPAIWSQVVDGTTAPLKHSDVVGIPASLTLSPDGKSILYSTWNKSSWDIFSIRLDSAGASRAFLTTSAMETVPEFSPDGRTVLVVSDESGVQEVYVRSFPDPGVRGLQVSAGGAVLAWWSADGTQVYYQWTNSLLTGKLLVGAGMPQLARRDTVLTRTGLEGVFAGGVTRDGARFIGVAPLDNDLKLVVSPNWIVEFREKIAARKR
jgi:Tol biopolymer transport system component/tRNA A-37 threonylcarbamoyl transferase component Bud32